MSNKFEFKDFGIIIISFTILMSLSAMYGHSTGYDKGYEDGIAGRESYPAYFLSDVMQYTPGQYIQQCLPGSDPWAEKPPCRNILITEVKDGWLKFKLGQDGIKELVELKLPINHFNHAIKTGFNSQEALLKVLPHVE